MENCDLLIHNCGQLLTCAAADGNPKKSAAMARLEIISGGAVAVRDEKIISVGASEDILGNFRSEKEIDAGGKVVSPAFVECHSHVVYAGNRFDEFELKIKGADYLEILRNGGGILSTVRETRRASLENLIEQSAARLEKMLRLGIGTCEIKTGYGLDAATELKMLEAVLLLNERQPIDLIPTFLPAHAVPFDDFRERNPDRTNEQIADSYTALICREMLPVAKRFFDQRRTANGERQTPEPRIFADVFCEKNAFDLRQSRKILETAKSLGYGLKAHVDEFTNLGAARMAIELGAVSVDHLDKISDAEIKLLAASQTIGVVTPTVNFNFGASEFADARKLIDANCAIAVSTDYNPGSAPCPSLPNAMAISCRYQKLLPAEVFHAATINAAFAVGAGSRTGSLEVGKQADIIIFDTKDYREIVYEFGGNPVKTMIKRGEILF